MEMESTRVLFQDLSTIWDANIIWMKYGIITLRYIKIYVNTYVQITNPLSI